MPAPYQNNTQQTVHRGPIVYKRIRIHDSDSDDNPTPVKKPNPAPSFIGQKVVELTTQKVVELTTAVKERRFRNMLEMFPEISPMVLASLYLLLFICLIVITMICRDKTQFRCTPAYRNAYLLQT